MLKKSILGTKSVAFPLKHDNPLKSVTYPYKCDIPL